MRSGRAARLAALGAVFLAGCAAEQDSSSAPQAATAIARPFFVEVAKRAGLDFHHHNGARGEFYYPELMQGGGGLFDYDNDGDLDVYLVQSGPLPPGTEEASARGLQTSAHGLQASANRLFENLGGARFADRTATSGLGDTGYGSGVAVADYDGDGWVDVYVTNLGPNRLFRNGGDGSFADVTASAGVGEERYSTSAAFLDFDRDGDLDLFVCNYVEWSPSLESECLGYHGRRGYCSPTEYPPVSDTLFRNDGGGHFTDVSREAGIAALRSTGLGVVATDFDGDGWTDVYVANDQRPNHLWINQSNGTFREEGLLRGAALNEQGRPEAGMGVLAEDLEADGDWDLFMVHLSGETNTLYRNQGGDFVDVTDSTGLGAVSQPYTGFGVGLYDFDHDGRRDLFIANGKVSPGDTVEPDYAEPNQLLLGQPDGGYRAAPVEPALALEEVSRAAAFGDVDNDGDIDVLVLNNDGPARLLLNAAGDRGHWLVVQTRGRNDRDAVGTRVELQIGDRIERREVRPASSYCASNDPRLHFGLGSHRTVDRLIVLWPSGAAEERVNVAADQFLLLEEPSRSSPEHSG